MAEPLEPGVAAQPANETQTPQGAETEQTQVFTPEYVKSLREENKRRRIEARELTAKVDSLTTRTRELLVKTAFNGEAIRAGIAYPEDAFKLADISGVEMDMEDEAVTGVAEAIESLRTNRPWLFRRDKPRPYGPETALAGSAPSPLDAAREKAMRAPSVKNIARYQAELARAKPRN